jgi:hypothetical protein
VTSDAALLERYRDAGRKEAGDISTPASACTSRAVVTWAETALTSPEASINANTLKPSATAEMCREGDAHGRPDACDDQRPLPRRAHCRREGRGVSQLVEQSVAMHDGLIKTALAGPPAEGKESNPLYRQSIARSQSPRARDSVGSTPRPTAFAAKSRSNEIPPTPPPPRRRPSLPSRFAQHHSNCAPRCLWPASIIPPAARRRPTIIPRPALTGFSRRLTHRAPDRQRLTQTRPRPECSATALLQHRFVICGQLLAD